MPPMPKTREAKLEHLVLGTLLVYVTLHLLEEGLFGFPAWAEARWRIPDYTVPKWLQHNVYFAFFGSTQICGVKSDTTTLHKNL